MLKKRAIGVTLVEGRGIAQSASRRLANGILCVTVFYRIV
jgi:hypothetical protein